MSVEFHVEGLDKLEKDLREAGKKSPEAVRQAMRYSLQLLARQAKLNAPVDMGILRGSIGDEAKQGILEVKGLGAEIVGKVGSRVVYALPQEIGRQPGKMPPPAALEEWAGRHGMAGMGFVIARAIGRRGMKGRHYLENAAKDKAGEVVELFRRKLDELLRGVNL